MKKIILSLFLLLGVFSFAAPSYVDVNRIKKDGYDIDVNDNDTLAFTQKGSNMNAVITTFISEPFCVKARVSLSLTSMS